MKKIITLILLFSLSYNCFSQVIESVKMEYNNQLSVFYSVENDTIIYRTDLDTAQIGQEYTDFMAIMPRLETKYVVIQNTEKQTREKNYPQRYIVIFKKGQPEIFRVVLLDSIKQKAYYDFIEKIKSNIL